MQSSHAEHDYSSAVPEKRHRRHVDRAAIGLAIAATAFLAAAAASLALGLAVLAWPLSGVGALLILDVGARLVSQPFIAAWASEIQAASRSATDDKSAAARDVARLERLGRQRPLLPRRAVMWLRSMALLLSAEAAVTAGDIPLARAHTLRTIRLTAHGRSKAARFAGSRAWLFLARLSLDEPPETLRLCDKILASIVGQPALEFRTTKAELQVMAGEALVALSRPDEAVIRFERAINEVPEGESVELAAQLYYRLGRILFHLDRLEEAECMLTRHLALAETTTVTELLRMSAWARHMRGNVLGQLERPIERLENDEQLVARWAYAERPDVRNLAYGTALLVAGQLRAMDRLDDAVQTLEWVAERAGVDPDGSVRTQAVQAHRMRCAWLESSGSGREALLRVRDAVSAFADDPEPEVRAATAGLALDAAGLVATLDGIDAQIAAIEHVIGRIEFDSGPAVSAVWVRANHNLSLALGQLGRTEAACAVQQRAVSRLGPKFDAASRRAAAEAAEQLAHMYGEAERWNEELASLEWAFESLTDADDDVLRASAARSLVDMGYRLGRLGRTEEALKTVDRLRDHVAESTDAELLRLLSIGLSNRVVWLGAANRLDERAAARDEVFSTFADDPSPARRALAAETLLKRAHELDDGGEHGEAADLYKRLVDRFGADPAPEVRKHAAQALLSHGFRLPKADHVSRVAAYTTLVDRFGADEAADVVSRVVQGQFNRAVEFLDLGDVPAAFRDLDACARHLTDEASWSVEVASLAIRRKAELLEKRKEITESLTTCLSALTHRNAESVATREAVAEVAVLWARIRKRVLGIEAGLQSLDEVTQWFGRDADLGVRGVALRALEDRLRILVHAGRLDEATMTLFEISWSAESDELFVRSIEALRTLADAYGDSEVRVRLYERAIREMRGRPGIGITRLAVRTVIDHGVIAGRLGRQAEELRDFRIAFAEFGEVDDVDVRVRVARAMRFETQIVEATNVLEGLRLWRRLRQWVGDDDEPELRSEVVHARGRQAALHRKLGERERARQLDVENAAQDATSLLPLGRRWVAVSLLELAKHHRASEELDAALDLLSDVERRFADDADPHVRLWVANAMFIKAGLLRKTRHDEAEAVIERLAGRGAADDLMGTREFMASALSASTAALFSAGAYADVLRRAAQAGQLQTPESSSALRWRVGNTRILGATTLSRLDRTSEAARAALEAYHDAQPLDAPELRHLGARMLVNGAAWAARSGRTEEAIRLNTEAMGSFGDDEGPATRDLVFTAARNLGSVLAAAGRLAEADAAFVDALERIADRGDSDAESMRTLALQGRLWVLTELGRSDEVIATNQRILVTAGSSSDPKQRAIAAAAGYAAAWSLSRQQRIDDAVDVHLDVAGRFIGDPIGESRMYGARSALEAGHQLQSNGRHTEAMQCYELMRSTVWDDADPAMRRHVAVAHFNWSRCLRVADEPQQALALLVEQYDRFATDEADEVRQWVGRGLVDRSQVLHQEDRLQEAYDVANLALRDYGDVGGDNGRLVTLFATMRAGRLAVELGKPHDGIELLDKAIRRYGDETDRATRIAVAQALLAKGQGLKAIGSRKDAIRTFTTCIERHPSPDETGCRVAAMRAGIELGTMLLEDSDAPGAARRLRLVADFVVERTTEELDEIRHEAMQLEQRALARLAEQH